MRRRTTHQEPIVNVHHAVKQSRDYHLDVPRKQQATHLRLCFELVQQSLEGLYCLDDLACSFQRFARPFTDDE